MTLGQRLAWIDGLSTVAVLAVVMAIWSTPTTDGGPWGLLARVGVIVLIAIAAFYYNDLYNFEVPHALPQLFARLCRALGLTALALAVTYLLFPRLIVGANVTSYAIVSTLAAVLAVRAVVYTAVKRVPFAERAIIMGAGPLAAELAAHIRERPDLASTLVGVVSAAPSAAGVPPFSSPDSTPFPTPFLGRYADIGAVVRRHHPDRIIVAMPDRRGNLPISELLAARFRGVVIEEGTHAYERFTRRLAVESLTPSALIFGDGFHVSRMQLALKRLLSVAVALVGLTVTAPLVALVAVLIKLESPGPVFFIQNRIGLGRIPFRLIKFRTMRVADRTAAPGDAPRRASRPTDDVWGRDNASRVTRVGAVLRRYRLDEIPQFVNILRGDMSLVGPRPEMVANVATFAAVIPFYNLRHEVRPGLTGWAQVKAGYSMSTEEVTRKLCYDLYYIKHLSLMFDLQILFDTVKFVLCGKRPG